MDNQDDEIYDNLPSKLSDLSRTLNRDRSNLWKRLKILEGEGKVHNTEGEWRLGKESFNNEVLLKILIPGLEREGEIKYPAMKEMIEFCSSKEIKEQVNKYIRYGMKIVEARDE